MVLNTAAPRAVYPCVAVVRAAAELAPALLVYCFFHQILGQPWGMSLLALPFVVVLLTLFSLGRRAADGTAGGVLPRHGHPAAVHDPDLDVRDAGDVHRRLHPAAPTSRRC